MKTSMIVFLAIAYGIIMIIAAIAGLRNGRAEKALGSGKEESKEV